MRFLGTLWAFLRSLPQATRNFRLWRERTRVWERDDEEERERWRRL